jgi:methyltransferase (TIGR00027 family)
MSDFFPSPASDTPAAAKAGILQAGRPSLTALQVAVLRAAHQLLDEPVVLDDPLALRILGAEREAAVRDDPFQYNEPMPRTLRASLVVRSRLAEDELARAVQRGVTQYVVLGAGLDTFACRNPHPGLKVYEIDHPATQAWKQAMLRDASIAVPDSVRFVPVDFACSTMTDGLRDAGFRADQPTFFSWLGVTMYLDDAAVLSSLREVAALPPGSGIVFDYQLLPSLLNPLEAMAMGQMAARVAERGEPWKSAFDPAQLADSLRDIGFTTLDDLGAEQLNQRYLARRKDGLRTGRAMRLMCAYR